MCEICQPFDYPVLFGLILSSRITRSTSGDNFWYGEPTRGRFEAWLSPPCLSARLVLDTSHLGLKGGVI